MSSLAGSAYVNEAPAKSGILAALIGIWSEVVRRHHTRQTIARISRLNPRLIRDIGFDPEPVDDIVERTWAQVESRFRTHE